MSGARWEYGIENLSGGYLVGVWGAKGTGEAMWVSVKGIWVSRDRLGKLRVWGDERGMSLRRQE